VANQCILANYLIKVLSWFMLLYMCICLNELNKYSLKNATITFILNTRVYVKACNDVTVY